MTDEDMVKHNCEAVLNTLNDTEVEIKEHIENRFFKPLSLRHWEGVEVKEYWKAMKKGQSSFKY